MINSPMMFDYQPGSRFSSVTAASLSSLNEQSIYRKYTAFRKAEKIAYDVTDDVALCFQYQQLRNMVIPGLRYANEKISAPGSASLIAKDLIAHQRNLCLGGVRLIISQPETLPALPIEQQGIALDSILKPSAATIAEINGLSILQGFEHQGVGFELIARVITIACGLDVQQLVSLVTRREIIYFNQAADYLGITLNTRKNCSIETEFGQATPISIDLSLLSKKLVVEKKLAQA